MLVQPSRAPEGGMNVDVRGSRSRSSSGSLIVAAVVVVVVVVVAVVVAATEIMRSVIRTYAYLPY